MSGINAGVDDGYYDSGIPCRHFPGCRRGNFGHVPEARKVRITGGNQHLDDVVRLNVGDIGIIFHIPHGLGKIIALEHSNMLKIDPLEFLQGADAMALMEACYPRTTGPAITVLDDELAVTVGVTELLPDSAFISMT